MCVHVSASKFMSSNMPFKRFSYDHAAGSDFRRGCRQHICKPQEPQRLILDSKGIDICYTQALHVFFFTFAKATTTIRRRTGTTTKANDELIESWTQKNTYHITYSDVLLGIVRCWLLIDVDFNSYTVMQLNNIDVIQPSILGQLLLPNG